MRSQKGKRERGCKSTRHNSNAEGGGLGPLEHRELENDFSKTSFILPWSQQTFVACLALCCLFTSGNPEPAGKARGTDYAYCLRASS